ncbi:hypothetical protein UFOVP48_17 [uncultured Caudovirales phage]|uniref:Uncharacterized protein n=1 Tax=uncultured Caudovirales phage TaxID=2100421 RepID=A0A6J5KME3_9CAUD|nr:hypothetical protein UFOVP48_17 [uncultured Caudovirales phage]
MKLKWEKRGKGTIALIGVLKGQGRTFGWVMPKGWRFSSEGDTGWIEVGIAGLLHTGIMPCEEARYYSLRAAMRALKETVVVLLIGRGL